jgi:PAS domain S-box-containing protein
MAFQNLSIKTKAVAVIMLTSIIALLLTAAAFTVYDLMTYKQTMIRHLSVTADIVAGESDLALHLNDPDNGLEILAALRGDPHIWSAALYDREGHLFAWYPTNQPASGFPAAPKSGGLQSEGHCLAIYTPVIREGARIGTLFVNSDLSGLSERLRLYAGIAVLVLVCSALVALALATQLQRGMTQPVLALAETSKKVAEKGDYSLRARKLSGDELGYLTDAFNQMLGRIEQQTVAVRDSEQRKSAILDSALDCIITMDQDGRIVDFNAAAERTFGYKREEIFGKTVGDTIVPERLRDAHRKGLARLKSTGQGPILGRRVEMPALRADGSEFPTELAIASTALEGGKLFFTAYLRDVSERKRAEEAVSFLAAIVESSDDAVVGKDLRGTVVSWNAGAERMFGHTAAEMVGQSIMRIISPDRPEEEPRLLDNVRSGATRHLETVRIHKDGHPVQVSLTISPIKSAAGEVIGLSSIARDVTERKRAQAALESQAAVLREQAQMLDLANVLARDLDNRIILWNTGMEKMYGWTKGEALGKISHELLKTESSQPFEAIREVLFKEGQWEGEFTHTRKDGKRVTVASQWVLHKDDRGRPAAILEINNDITERKRAEQDVQRSEAQLRLVWENALDGMRLIDGQGTIRLVNEAYCHLVQKPREELEGKPLWTLYQPEHAEEIMRQHQQRFAERSVPRHYETEVTLWNGKRLFIELSNSFLDVEGGEPLLVTVFRDISDRKRAEEEVRQLNEQLERRVQERTAELTVANRELEAFTYSVAHDLRAPLRHIDAFSRIVYEDFAADLPPEAKSYLENIRNGSRNMSHLVDDLLNLARVGRQELKRQPVPLGPLVAEVMAELKRETEGRPIEWRIEALPIIECDSGLMKQVFANLLSNAVKYTRPRQVAVIEVGQRQMNGQTAIFVRDNGVGFNMKYADKLFGVFQRLHRAEQFEGTGVGLATVERIVRKHGGKVWAEAAVEQGATFYFTVAAGASNGS